MMVSDQKVTFYVLRGTFDVIRSVSYTWDV
jgi:hypothetical protein